MSRAGSRSLVDARRPAAAWTGERLQAVRAFLHRNPRVAVFAGVLLLLLSAVAAFGQNLRSVAVVIGVLGFPAYYRLTRAQVLQARELAYVEAARALGLRSWRLLWRHILPNIASPLIIVVSVTAGG